MKAFTVHDVLQRSPEWHALRCGKVTGSCAGAILQQRKRGTGELAVRRDLRHQLVSERLTGLPTDDDYQSKAMAHGVEYEPDALAAYEAATGELVQIAGFLSHQDLETGYSPDGYIGDFDGLLEIKCPATTTHLEYIKADVIPEEYVPQLLHGLWLTGAQWVDFCSFDPRYPDGLKLFRKRLERNPVELDAYELLLRQFLREVDEDVARLTAVAV